MSETNKRGNNIVEDQELIIFRADCLEMLYRIIRGKKKSI